MLIPDFAFPSELTIVISYFRKREDHLVTFMSDITKTQIDYFFIRADNRLVYKDYKVILSEQLGTQHQLLVMHVENRSSKRKKRLVSDPKIKWWNLTSENAIKLA